MRETFLAGAWPAPTLGRVLQRAKTVRGAQREYRRPRLHRLRYASVFLRPCLAFFSKLSMDAMTMLDTLVLKRWAASGEIWGRGTIGVSSRGAVLAARRAPEC